MDTAQLLVQTGVTFVAAGAGSILGAFLARRNDHFKHVLELRSAAYADFLRGFARVGRAQVDRGDAARSKLEELEGRAMVTDSRSRIVIYGSAAVVRALAQFTRRGTQTLTPEGMQAFAEMCSLMREEASQRGTPREDIETALFG